MKRWLLWIVVIVVVFAIGWYYFHRGGTSGTLFSSSSTTGDSSSDQSAARPARITWQKVERPQDGILLEMPTGAKDFQAPAYNLNGSTEQIAMLVSNPDATTTFAFDWELDPPVAREITGTRIERFRPHGTECWPARRLQSSLSRRQQLRVTRLWI